MPDRSRSWAAALASVAITGLAFALAGCGSQVSGAPARPASPPASPAVSVNPGGPVIRASSSPAPSSASPVPPSGACGGMRVLPAQTGTGVLTLSNSSNGGTFCVLAGQRVDVYLTGAPGRMWVAIHSDSGALTALTRGHLMLPAGVTGAFFVALHHGVAHLSSARRVCAAMPIRCDSLVAFRATVVVSGLHG